MSGFKKKKKKKRKRKKINAAHSARVNPLPEVTKIAMRQ